MCTLIWLVALTHIWVDLALSTLLTRSFLLLCSCYCLGVVGNHLAWCHGTEDKVLVVALEAIVIGPSIMHCTLAILPWTSKKQVTNGHRHHITINGIFIGSNLEGHLHHVLDLDGSGITQPLHMVWVWVLLKLQVRLITKFFTR